MMKNQGIRPDTLSKFYDDKDGNRFPVFEICFTATGMLFKCRRCAEKHPINSVVGIQYGSVVTGFELECPNCGAQASFTGAFAVTHGETRWEDRVKEIEGRVNKAVGILRGRI